MNLIKKEIKEWVEFFIRNIPGKIGFFFRSTYYKLRIKSSLKKIDLNSVSELNILKC